MDDKLPHERLREWAREAEDGGYFASACMTSCMLDSGEIDYMNGFDNEVSAFRRLADEIERFYLPRPRFEDGEPVQFGDEVELHDYSGCYAKGILQELNVNRGSILLLSLTDADHSHAYRYDIECDTIKRPAPKVLDADGVPIEVGDAVWLIDSPTGIEEHAGERLKVEAAVDGCVNVRTESGMVMLPHNGQLTHREPDSLERLLDDIAAYKTDMAEPGSILDDALGEWADRLAALIERGEE